MKQEKGKQTKKTKNYFNVITTKESKVLKDMSILPIIREIHIKTMRSKWTSHFDILQVVLDWVPKCC